MRYESAVLVIVLVLAGIAIGVPLGVYGHWSGWGFGLGWWAKPTPARGWPLVLAAAAPFPPVSPPSVAEWAGSRRPSRSGA